MLPLLEVEEQGRDNRAPSTDATLRLAWLSGVLEGLDGSDRPRERDRGGESGGVEWHQVPGSEGEVMNECYRGTELNRLVRCLRKGWNAPGRGGGGGGRR